MASKRYYRVLTIAGSDSGGGAGIQADIKTFSALGCYGMSVVTALTSQNTTEVRSIFDVSADFVAEQIDLVVSDLGVDAVKLGMLHRREIIRAVADRLAHHKVPNIVLDPVMIAKSRTHLLSQDAVDALRDHLLPLARIVTPNLPEASILLGREVRAPDQMETAGSDLLKTDAQIFVLKGGHLDGPESNDLICAKHFRKWVKSKRVLTVNTHGTGCTFSAAIAAYLAQGVEPVLAIEQAKAYLTGAIEAGASFRIGSGHGPVHHFYRQ